MHDAPAVATVEIFQRRPESGATGTMTANTLG